MVEEADNEPPADAGVTVTVADPEFAELQGEL
jgi:hypothetical protein